MIKELKLIPNEANEANDEINTNLDQIRVVETDGGLVIKHFVAERERLYSEYSAFAAKTAQSTVEMCRVVFEAKKGLSQSDYSEFLYDIGHTSENSTIRKYLAIGEQYNKLIQYTKSLPNSWTSIYTITQLSSDTFDALTATDTDMSKMSGKDIKSLVELNKPKQSASSSSIPSKSSVIATQTVQVTSAQQLDSEVANASTEKYDADDGIYEVVVRFKSPPSDDSWWNLTEEVESIIEKHELNVDVTETRPPLCVLI